MAKKAKVDKKSRGFGCVSEVMGKLSLSVGAHRAEICAVKDGNRQHVVTVTRANTIYFAELARALCTLASKAPLSSQDMKDMKKLKLQEMKGSSYLFELLGGL